MLSKLNSVISLLLLSLRRLKVNECIVYYLLKATLPSLMSVQPICCTCCLFVHHTAFLLLYVTLSLELAYCFISSFWSSSLFWHTSSQLFQIFFMLISITIHHIFTFRSKLKTHLFNKSFPPQTASFQFCILSCCVKLRKLTRV